MKTSRVSIDVTPEQHKQLKAVAALSGKTLKEYVLEKTLPSNDKEAAMNELVEFLKPRIEEARSGELIDQSPSEVAKEVYAELGIE